VIGVAGALQRHLRGRTLDVVEIAWRQLDGRRAEVLLEPVPLRRARDGHNPWSLRQQPREGDLSRRRLLPFANRAQQIDEDLIGLPRLWR
jgi:hypothetical protein